MILLLPEDTPIYPVHRLQMKKTIKQLFQSTSSTLQEPIPFQSQVQDCTSKLNECQIHQVFRSVPSYVDSNSISLIMRNTFNRGTCHEGSSTILCQKTKTVTGHFMTFIKTFPTSNYMQSQASVLSCIIISVLV